MRDARSGCLGGRGAAADQTREHPEPDATGDHGRGTDEQEGGLGGAGLRQLLLGLALLDRLRTGVVGVGTARGAGTGATVGATGLTLVGATALALGGATIGSTVSTAVSATIGTAVSTTIGTAVSTTIGTAVSATIGTAVSTAVSATIGTAVSATIGTAVGTAVSATIGSTVGTAVSATIGTAVGTAVSATIGTAVSTAIGSTVSATIGTRGGADDGVAAVGAFRGALGVTEAEADVQAVLVDVRLGAQATDVDIDADGRSGARGGQRSTGCDHRAGGYPRYADPRLLGHVLATPSS
ncbi:hypothetical protein ACFTTN_12050 [Streptomyces niveus]|uniref:hypothetical protein n=1 Tax=Streptomyces niveus TaxID=193462 RepID=UPI00363505A4